MEDANERVNKEGLLIDVSKYPDRPKNKRPPYGYVQKVGDPYLLVPDPAVIPFLEQALDQLDAGIPLRIVVEWLNDKTSPVNVSLSHSGLAILRKNYRPNHPKIKPKSVKRLSPDEKAAKKRRLLIAQEKKKIKAAHKRAARLGEELQIIKENTLDAKDRSLLMELDYSSPEYAEIEKEEIPVIFRPNPGPQTLFFAAEESEVLYGGAAGGGKSYALIADPMRYFDNKNFRGLILRRTNDELRELIWKSQELYLQIWKDAQWREKDKEWRFPSGARLWMTYLERDEDVQRYQGQSFTYIGIDELTQYATPFAWSYLKSRLRTADPTVPLFMRATSNPGGPGHGWVKKMFVDPAPRGKAFWAIDIDTGETLVYPKNHPKAGQPLFKRRFIPAKLQDNPFIWDDGNYETNLLSLPEQQRKQLLEGDWSISDGAAFSEFSERIHTCEPFEISPNWRRFRSCDFGYSTYSAVHWYAITPENDLVVYRELYVSKKTGKELAQMVLDKERGEKVLYGVLDSSVWAQRGQSGPSIAEEMIAEGCRWRPSDRTAGSRINGKNRLHELLKVNKYTQKPGIMFFNTCRQIISDLPMIPMDPKGGEDIDDRYASDHAYDSLRYGIMTRPRANEVLSLASFKKPSWTPSDPTFGY